MHKFESIAINSKKNKTIGLINVNPEDIDIRNVKFDDPNLSVILSSSSQDFFMGSFDE